MAPLTYRLNDHGIQALSGKAVMLHAAGLSTSTGDVVGLVAESGTGKSTAAAVLCHRDFGYVTDETLAVLSDGEVVPFPKPLCMTLHGRSDKVCVSPDALHLAPHAAIPLRLSRLALLHRTAAERGEPRVEAIDFGQACVEMIGQTSGLLRLERPVQEIAKVVAMSRPVRIRYAEAADLGDCLRDLVAEELAPVTWTPIDLSGVPIWRSVVDAIETPDGDVVMLVEDRPVLLRGPAAKLWQTARHVQAGEDVESALLAGLGEIDPARVAIASSLLVLLQREGALTSVVAR